MDLEVQKIESLPTTTTSSFPSSSSPSSSSSFSPLHHEKTRASYSGFLHAWHRKIDEGRCAGCWLRSYDCCCESYLLGRQKLYESLGAQSVDFLIYYHFRELGRSANTAHVLELLLQCPTIVYGDHVKELALAAEIRQEVQEGRQRTVVLYPSSEALSLSQWFQSSSGGDCERNKGPCSNPRFVLLDGTYSDARKMVKHLQHLLAMDGTKHIKRM